MTRRIAILLGLLGLVHGSRAALRTRVAPRIGEDQFIKRSIDQRADLRLLCGPDPTRVAAEDCRGGAT